MQTINPVDLNNPGQAENILDAVKVQLGGVPNIFATMANSPQVLEGYLAFAGSLKGGAIDAKTAEQIALAVAGSNACDYCASAHSALARGAGVDEAEIANNLHGRSADDRTAQLITFVRNVVANRGLVSNAEVDTLRDAGFDDQQLVEIIAHVGLNIFTNYFNHIARTEIDFPLVKSAA